MYEIIYELGCRVGEIKKTAENIVSLKGVRLGRINFVATEQGDD